MKESLIMFQIFSELSDTQRAVIDIMKGLLNRDKLGVNDDFYEAGREFTIAGARRRSAESEYLPRYTI